jgi:Domain of unknown function (DUF3885)
MDHTFDATWGRAFKNSPYRLRFELGGEEFGCADAPVPRFVRALTRSRAIRDAVFAETFKLWAIVASAAHPSNGIDAPVPDGFEALSNIGFKSSAIAEWRARLDVDDPEQNEEDFIWRAFDVTSDIASRDTLLWCSIAYEMPIEPKSPVETYLVDLERGILVHVYDDRGMDVSALTASVLLPFYKKFDNWLLDYDRERMEATFAGA